MTIPISETTRPYFNIRVYKSRINPFYGDAPPVLSPYCTVEYTEGAENLEDVVSLLRKAFPKPDYFMSCDRITLKTECVIPSA